MMEWRIPQAYLDQSDRIAALEAEVARLRAVEDAARRWHEAERRYDRHKREPHSLDACPTCRALWREGVLPTKAALVALLPPA